MSVNVVRPLFWAVACAWGVSIWAEPASAQAAPKAEADPFAAVLFPPELIMQHARAIRLDDQQRHYTRHIGSAAGRSRCTGS
jgi:hypothetical protein